jgi:hypothetical protein
VGALHGGSARSRARRQTEVYSRVFRRREVSRLSQSHQILFIFLLILLGLSFSLPGTGEIARYYAVVERLTNADRACAVAAAAAHDFNDELTIIVNSASKSILLLEPGHPARPYIADIETAVQRCVWKAAGLLTYTARRGVRPVSATMERVVTEVEPTEVEPIK